MSEPSFIVSVPDTLDEVLDEMVAIRSEIIADSAGSRPDLALVHPNYRESASNLLHYLALRRRDLRPLQRRLAALGLSSLGRAESHVLATIDAVIGVLHRLTQRSWHPPHAEAATVDFTEGQHLLAEHTATLLGPALTDRQVRIMVTMPSAVADDYTLILDLLRQGMDCIRINCAHDGPEVWTRMIEHLRRAEQTVGRTCRIVMDLAGPKLRTGPIEAGPAVVRVHPQRDLHGGVVAPARVWLTAESAPHPAPTEADAILPVAASWLAMLSAGVRVKLEDARGAKRILEIVDVTPHGCWAETTQTGYLVPGTVVRQQRRGTKGKGEEATIGDLPRAAGVIHLSAGDRLIIARDATLGRDASRDGAGRILTPATIGSTIPEVFDDVRAGESIWFDDGKIGGVIERIEPERVVVKITQTKLGGAKLRADRGINLPESALRLGALTPDDLENLKFVAAHADVVELSFANSAHDVELLQRHLASAGNRTMAIVLKVETRRGFENLPEMLLMAMRSPCCGVMIARGDLAVETGFERLAEVQEEILWICEAAHVPVIWATQVLESLATEGMPSRAEITDAAMAHRAECVMLNKGPHVQSAVQLLDGILRRMQAHQTKKSAMLRELRLAHTLPPDREPAEFLVD